MLKVVADDKIPFLKGALEPCAEVRYLPGAKISKADVKDADALLVRTRTRCDAELLEGTNVKFVATATIGYDHIDAAFCESKGIFWTNAPGCNSASVAQYIASVLLSTAIRRKLPLRGAALGVAGVGNVGSKVAAVGRALGMRVLLNDPPRERNEGGGGFVPLETLLRESDFLTFHVPLTHEGPDKTFHLADAALFGKLERSPFFINSSRGEVTDEAALKDALRSGAVKGAALDVWENEPDIDIELLSLVGIGTPHIAGYSADGKANGSAMSVNALAKHFSLPLHDWFPKDVPPPLSPLIEVEAGGTFEEAVFRAVGAAYDVREDATLLRSSPETFEKQRGDYPVRREFPAFSVRFASPPSPEVEAALRALGFRL